MEKLGQKLFWFAGILLSALIMSAQSHAGVISFVVEENGKTIDQVAEVDTNRVLVKAVGGDSSQDLVFDVERQILFVVNHANKNYLQIDRKIIAEVSVLMESLSGVAGGDGVLGDILSGLGVSGETVELPQMENVKRQLKIGRFPCQLFQSHLNQTLQAEICIAGNESLQLNDIDYQSMRTFLDFSDSLLTEAGDLLSTLGISLPKMKLASTSGLPIGLHSVEEKLKVRLLDIAQSEGTPAGSYEIPNNYIRQPIPFLSN